jgi:hypothetical protein
VLSVWSRLDGPGRGPALRALSARSSGLAGPTWRVCLSRSLPWAVGRCRSGRLWSVWEVGPCEACGGSRPAMRAHRGSRVGRLIKSPDHPAAHLRCWAQIFAALTRRIQAGNGLIEVDPDPAHQPSGPHQLNQRIPQRRSNRHCRAPRSGERGLSGERSLGQSSMAGRIAQLS